MLVVATALALACASSALAAGGYILDSELSLTGSCGVVTKTDPVEDPGCPGGEHPPKAFTSPRSVVTDFYGDIYVASYGNEAANGAEGRIDIFDPSGVFIGEVPDSYGPKDLAVDAKGNLYVFDKHPGVAGRVMRFSPTAYEPGKAEIEYGEPPVVVVEQGAWFLQSIAVNPADNHLFVYGSRRVEEFNSAEEGNEPVGEPIGEGVLTKADGQGLAVDAAHGLLYVGDEENIRVFDLAPPHKLIRTVDGSAIPVQFTSFVSVAADEANGKLFVLDGNTKKSVYVFLKDGTYVETLEQKFAPIFGSEIYVDNGPFSPHSGVNAKAKAGYLFVPSEEKGTSQSLALAPRQEFPPEVEAISFANVTQEDTELRATIYPGGLATEYVFQYTTQEAFEAEGFAGAATAGEGVIPAGLTGVQVSATAAGLSPETEYRFQVVATNKEGSDKDEASFVTYSAPDVFGPCLNDATRTGLSALLPDCRAYELVTPPSTNARAPRGIGVLGLFFATREASPDGGKVSFITEGGTLAGNEGTGSLSGDPYLATRGPNGWSTASAGPSGAESPAPLNGSTSPDQGYSFWESSAEGSAAVEGKPTTYVRYPDGHSALVGRGSSATDPRAEGNLISENGGHIIFASRNVPSISHTAVQLEPNAPPDGTQAVYDRTADEVTYVVSLLPGNVTPAAGENAEFVGASLDGEGVAFEIAKTLYFRYHNEETYKVGKGVTFAGIVDGGRRIFYLEGGNLYALDVETEAVVPFAESGDATVVNVSPDGTVAYFASPSKLTAAPNPNGAEPEPGGENLYRSEEGALSFVGTVTEEDMLGEENGMGLGLWTPHVVSYGEAAEEPSRTTPDGSVLLFESRADLTGYDSGGHTEIYRYDSAGGSLTCLSCNPTQAPATGDASLQSAIYELGGAGPFNLFVNVNNLRPDGRRAFFQSTEALVQGDTDGLQDVYEWEAQGVGSCERPGGCIYLISSGHSDRIDYLYGVSDSGDDVFFRTSDLLLPSDKEETPSIYDARVGGGFVEPVEEKPCQGEACRPALTPSPGLPTPGMLPDAEPGNPKPPQHCPKGKHRVTKNGKTRCVKKHRKHKHHRTGSRRGAGK